MSIFKELVEKYTENIALIDDEGRSMTYGAFGKFIEHFSTKLVERSFVFCLCKNSIGSLLGYFTFINKGLVPLMLDASIDADLLKKLVEIYKPNYLWLPDNQLIAFQNFKVVHSEYDYSLIKYTDTPLLLHSSLALLLTTSGSTGSPKLVRLSYDNIKANAESIAAYLQINDNERPVTTLPMYYSYGLSVINSHLIKGATLLLTDKSIAQKEFWTFVKEQKATSMSGVPYTYEMLKRLRFFRMDLPHIKTLTQAGGKLSSELVKEFVDDAKVKDRRFIVMYGQTEATARMSYLPFENAPEKCQSIGIAIPGGKFSLIDDKGLVLNAENTDGELVYTGANVSLGYAECREDLTKGDENKGILHTGDIARRDTDGFYYITGRLKRFIKIYGNRVNLDASEQIVKTLTSDCACVGLDDKMIIYVTDESLLLNVRNLISEKTGLNYRAFEVRFISKIPKNASGKVQYAELKNE